MSTGTVSAGTIERVCVGRVETFRDADGREMTSAVRKRPVEEPVAVTSEGLARDASAHPSHRGPNMWIHAFPAQHYAWFEARAGRRIPVPAFGENLSMSGCDEQTVRVGDVVRAGTALLQVTQPTVRCSTLGRAAGLPLLLDWIEESLFTGWYYRVLEPGTVTAGDRWELVRQGTSRWTIDRLNRALLRELHDRALVQELVASPDLTPEWKGSLSRRAARLHPGGTATA